MQLTHIITVMNTPLFQLGIVASIVAHASYARHHHVGQRMRGGRTAQRVASDTASVMVGSCAVSTSAGVAAASNTAAAAAAATAITIAIAIAVTNADAVAADGIK